MIGFMFDDMGKREAFVAQAREALIERVIIYNGESGEVLVVLPDLAEIAEEFGGREYIVVEASNGRR